MMRRRQVGFRTLEKNNRFSSRDPLKCSKSNVWCRLWHGWVLPERLFPGCFAKLVSWFLKPSCNARISQAFDSCWASALSINVVWAGETNCMKGFQKSPLFIIICKGKGKKILDGNIQYLRCVTDKFAIFIAVLQAWLLDVGQGFSFSLPCFSNPLSSAAVQWFTIFITRSLTVSLTLLAVAMQVLYGGRLQTIFCRLTERD